MRRAPNLMQHNRITNPASSTGPSSSPNPTGGRIHKPEHEAARSAAHAWAGMPDDFDFRAPLRLLKRPPVAEHFGLTGDQLKVLQWHFDQTRKPDWQPGSRPVAGLPKWCACNDLSISPKSLDRIEFELACHGLIYWHDSASCRRFYKRDKATGRLVHSYGVDLSPLAALLPTIENAAKQIQELRNERIRLRHRISAIRRLTLNRIHALTPNDRIGHPIASSLLDDATALPSGSRLNKADLQTLQALEPIAERIQRDVDALFTSECDQRPDDNPVSPHRQDASDNKFGRVPTPLCGEGSITNTNHSRINNVVAATLSETPQPDPESAARPAPESGICSHPDPASSSSPQAPPKWLVLDSLSPRIACHLPITRPPGNSDLLEAANRARSTMGISPDAWREACNALTRDGAALAIIIIASRLDASEIRSPGGYLRGMIDKARLGQLNLARSLWGVVDRASPDICERQDRDALLPTAQSDTPPNIAPTRKACPPASRQTEPCLRPDLPSLEQQYALLSLSGDFADSVSLPFPKPLDPSQVAAAVRQILSSTAGSRDDVQPTLSSAWHSACAVVGEPAATSALLIVTAGASHGLCRKAPSQFFAEIIAGISKHALNLERAASSMLEALGIALDPSTIPSDAHPERRPGAPDNTVAANGKHAARPSSNPPLSGVTQ